MMSNSKNKTASSNKQKTDRVSAVDQPVYVPSSPKRDGFSVDISAVEYSMFKSDQQKASATIGIQFGFNILGASDINSPAELRDLAMDHYRIIERVADALHLYSCDYFSPLIRQSLRREQNNYPRTFSLTFTTNWYEAPQI